MGQKFDVLVIGAGAAGLMCAAEAGKRGRRVAVIEHADRPGKKILISGGGRCNFTNIHCGPGTFHLGQPALREVGAGAVYACGFHRPGGKTSHPLSRENSRTALLRPCGYRHYEHARSGMPGGRGEGISQQQNSRGAAGRGLYCAFRRPNGTAEFQAPALVVATGGLSIPKMGATAFGYDLARQFGTEDRSRPGQRSRRCFSIPETGRAIAIWRECRRR